MRARVNQNQKVTKGNMILGIWTIVITALLICTPYGQHYAHTLQKLYKSVAEGSTVQKAQSAMEYLMTYGWAILIIAVVLAALFSLNVFSGGANLGASCVGQPGFSCSQAEISSAGMLTLLLGQGIGYKTYNVLLSCVASSNSLSANLLPYNSIGASGVGYPLTVASTGNTFSSGSTIPVTNLLCYPGTGGYSPTELSPIGTSFTGVIWMSYAATSGGPQQYVKIATVSGRSSN